MNKLNTVCLKFLLPAGLNSLPPFQRHLPLTFEGFLPWGVSLSSKLSNHNFVYSVFLTNFSNLFYCVVINFNTYLLFHIFWHRKMWFYSLVQSWTLLLDNPASTYDEVWNFKHCVPQGTPEFHRSIPKCMEIIQMTFLMMYQDGITDEKMNGITFGWTLVQAGAPIGGL